MLMSTKMGNIKSAQKWSRGFRFWSRGFLEFFSGPVVFWSRGPEILYLTLVELVKLQ